MPPPFLYVAAIGSDLRSWPYNVVQQDTCDCIWLRGCKYNRSHI